MSKLKEELIELACSLETLGLSSVGPGKGSCSVRDSENRLVFVTPSGKPYSQVSEESLVAVDYEGNTIHGGKPTVDIVFHRAIYLARSEINCVIHLHSPYATAFAVNRQEIPMYMQALANTVGWPVPVADFALPGTSVLGENIVKAMDNKINAVLMANHGLVVCAPSPKEGLTIASTVEVAAQVTIMAKLLGKPVELTQEQIIGAKNFYATNFIN